MRIMGFTKNWDKLNRTRFTTFRVERKDRDWEFLEKVQVVLKPRSREREYLGIAQIIGRAPKNITEITVEEAKLDGFSSKAEMVGWLIDAHPNYEFSRKYINKLTLVWVDKVVQ